MGYGGRIAWTSVIILIVAAGVYIIFQHKKLEEAQNELGIDASRVLTAVFTQASELKVARLRGAVLARSECNSLDVFANSQKAVAPYSVDYTLDLTKLPTSAYHWNANDRIMSIDIPDVKVADPNIDMSRARLTQSGVFISRACGITMQKVAAKRLAGAARHKAEDEENVRKARNAARRAVIQFVKAPLQAVGFGNVQIAVRLPGEQKPLGLDRVQWDVSRSITEVLEDFR